jgi:hypothetical protein
MPVILIGSDEALALKIGDPWSASHGQSQVMLLIITEILNEISLQTEDEENTTLHLKMISRTASAWNLDANLTLVVKSLKYLFSRRIFPSSKRFRKS